MSTLPSVTQLGLVVPCVAFPMSHFLSFVSRSSLSSSLQTQSLRVRVTDDDLLRCLTSLRSLTRLGVYDVCPRSEMPEHIVITDRLLHGVAEFKRPIPFLSSLELTSYLRFNDESLLKFAVSAAGTVRIRLRSLPDARMMDETVVTQLLNGGVAVLS